MSKFAFAKGAPGVALGGLAAVLAVAAGLYLSRTLFPESSGDPVPVPAAQTNDAVPAATEQVEDTEVAAVADPASETETGSVAVTEEAALPPETPGEAVGKDAAGDDTARADDGPSVNAPSFDIVRVAPDGRTLVAGSALGAQLVRILVDGTEVATTSVDGLGKFVAFLELPGSDQPRVVSLMSESSLGAVESRDQVIIAPSVQVAVAERAPDTPGSLAEGGSEQASSADSEAPSSDVAGSVAEATPQTEDAASQSPAATDVAVGAPEDETPSAQGGDTDVATVADTPDPDPVVSSQQATQQATAQDVPVVQDESAVEMALAEPPAAEPTSPQATLPLASPVDRPETPEGPLPDQLAAPGAAEAPAVILSTEAGVEVLQSGGAQPQALDQIALDAITYEDAGSVFLSGRGVADEFVRVYIDNQPVQTTAITSDGRWRADLPDVDSGTYTLRVDAVDSEGTVVSRVESPFLREDPVLLAQAIERGEATATVQVVTVQPGNTLWAIARDRYGEGPAYVRVFEANRDRIRDPDLIYPGQVFSIPN